MYANPDNKFSDTAEAALITKDMESIRAEALAQLKLQDDGEFSGILLSTVKGTIIPPCLLCNS